MATGFPYGAFSYGDALGPRAFGLVPYLLPVSYVPLVIGAVAATWTPRSVPVRVAISALLLVLLDGVLDPGAVALGFWEYEAAGAYYGVPLSNFAGWLLSGAVSAALLLYLGRWRDPPPPGALDGAILALAFWTGTALFAGLIPPMVLGAALFTSLLARRSRLRSTQKYQ